MPLLIALMTLTVALTAGATVSSGAGTAGSPCTTLIRGTAASETLTATAASTRLLGLEGDDRITGGPGADCIDGGPGDDRLSGRGGADTLTGGPGVDKLSGGAGGDTLSDVPERYDAGVLAGSKNRLTAGGGHDRVETANGRRDLVHCGAGSDLAIADREDRLAGCEKKRFLRSPVPQAAPAVGGRQQMFMVRFRAIEEVASQGEYFSIAVSGPVGRDCGRLVTNSLGIRYRGGETVRYRVEPFGRDGRAAKRWCRGLYRGTVQFVRLPVGCPAAAGEQAPACAEVARVGRFSFRVG
jgi:RTX calcium-binding nonapeptide repeat (4 copies)